MSGCVSLGLSAWKLCCFACVYTSQVQHCVFFNQTHNSSYCCFICRSKHPLFSVVPLKLDDMKQLMNILIEFVIWTTDYYLNNHKVVCYESRYELIVQVIFVIFHTTHPASSTCRSSHFKNAMLISSGNQIKCVFFERALPRRFFANQWTDIRSSAKTVVALVLAANRGRWCVCRRDNVSFWVSRVFLWLDACLGE